MDHLFAMPPLSDQREELVPQPPQPPLWPHLFSLAPLDNVATPPPNRSAPTPGSTAGSRQGSYDRQQEGVGVRLSSLAQARRHRSRIQETALAGACTAKCAVKQACPNLLTRNDLLRCHEISYGVEVQQGRAKTLVLSVDDSKRSHAWRQLFLSFCTWHADEKKPAFAYTVAGHAVCGSFARAAYGIPESTWLKLTALANKGRAHLERAEGMAEFQSLARAELQQTSTNEAVQWWRQQLRMWEPMPNESCIKHPRLVWELLHKDVYAPEIGLWWTCPALTAANGKAPGSWFAARKKALTELSIEDFGLQPSEECRASPDPQPRTMYTLLERPNHSNFAQCKKCGQNEREMTQAVANRAQRGVRAAIMQQQIWHIAKVNAERAAISEWANDAVRSSSIVFTVDDKCGSHWLHLPMPTNMRDRKDTASRWSYRGGLQNNSWPGAGNFLSIVPPMLQVGANFGCTGFAVTLYHLIERKKLAPTVEVIFRQTDRGPDNNAAITHAVHTTLIREGVAQKMYWVALEAGHSHNSADKTFNDSKMIFYPRTGTGPGCASPFEYAASLEEGLKQMNGGCEVLWQLTNYNWEALLKDCISTKFAGFR